MRITAQFDLHKYKEDDGSHGYEIVDQNIIVEVPVYPNGYAVKDDLNLEHLLDYFSEDEFEYLREGDYVVYLQGTIDWLSEIDWESGLSDGEWILNYDYINIMRVDNSILVDEYKWSEK
jgi:hypothetical protein